MLSIPYPLPYPSDIRLTNIHIRVHIRISKNAYHILKNRSGAEIIRTIDTPRPKVFDGASPASRDFFLVRSRFFVCVDDLPASRDMGG